MAVGHRHIEALHLRSANAQHGADRMLKFRLSLDIQEAVFILPCGAVAHIHRHVCAFPAGIGQFKYAVVAAGGVLFPDIGILQQDLIVVGPCHLKIVVKAAGGGHIVRSAAQNRGHHHGAARGKAKNFVGEVAVLHTCPKNGGDDGGAVGGLGIGSGGLKQMADGTDVGVYILGIVNGMHKKAPHIFFVFGQIYHSGTSIKTQAQFEKHYPSHKAEPTAPPSHRTSMSSRARYHRVEGSSHQYTAQHFANAKILRLPSVAQNDTISD